MTNKYENFNRYLAETSFLDFKHPAVSDYAKSVTRDDFTSRAKAVSLYYSVRDDIEYDPYNVSFTLDGLKASSTLSMKSGWCVPKAILLAAACRAVGIPSRLGYADVKNHLTSLKLKDILGTDVFVYHGYTELFLNYKWVKCTPAFNRSLCEKLSIIPLEFNGENDSIFHKCNSMGKKHMEYIHDHGQYVDVPLDDIIKYTKKKYPNVDFNDMFHISGNFHEDARNYLE